MNIQKCIRLLVKDSNVRDLNHDNLFVNSRVIDEVSNCFSTEDGNNHTSPLFLNKNLPIPVSRKFRTILVQKKKK